MSGTTVLFVISVVAVFAPCVQFRIFSLQKEEVVNVPYTVFHCMFDSIGQVGEAPDIHRDGGGLQREVSFG